MKNFGNKKLALIGGAMVFFGGVSHVAMAVPANNTENLIRALPRAVYEAIRTCNPHASVNLENIVTLAKTACVQQQIQGVKKKLAAAGIVSGASVCNNTLFPPDGALDLSVCMVGGSGSPCISQACGPVIAYAQKDYDSCLSTWQGFGVRDPAFYCSTQKPPATYQVCKNIFDICPSPYSSSCRAD